MGLLGVLFCINDIRKAAKFKRMGKDALLTFDDGRMTLAVDYLSALDQQVLLFSCQQREANLGTGNILTLQS